MLDGAAIFDRPYLAREERANEAGGVALTENAAHYADNGTVVVVTFVAGGNGVAIRETTGVGVGTGSVVGRGDDVVVTPVRNVVTLPIVTTSSAWAMSNTSRLY